ASHTFVFFVVRFSSATHPLLDHRFAESLLLPAETLHHCRNRPLALWFFVFIAAATRPPVLNLSTSGQSFNRDH
ncbi:hypothetical protein V2J09_011578, partial [Rumex salicifolius]